MRTFVKNCECREDEKKQTWIPTQEQLDCTAPGGDHGYFPGMYCLIPADCKHILSYEDLKNKPRINGTMLVGDKSCVDIKIQCRMRPITNKLIDDIFEAYK